MTKTGIQILITSVCIPIFSYFYYKPKLNQFFKLFLLTFFLSTFSEIAAYISRKQYGTNLEVYLAYTFINIVVISKMWYSLDSYNQSEKKSILGISSTILFLSFVATFVYSIHESTFILITLNVLLYLCLGLQYFYHKIKNVTYKSKLLDDIYLIVAAAFVMHALSSSVFMAARSILPLENRMDALFVRQLFFLIYYLISAFVFYSINKNQEKT